MPPPSPSPATGSGASGPRFHLSDTTPSGRSYTDPAVLSEELERFFYRQWLCVGRVDEVPEEGDFVTRQIGAEHLLLVNRGEGRLAAYYNLCRHRGTVVVTEPRGRGMRSFVCPYHAWSYGLDGRLIGAPHMKGTIGFERAEHGLWPVHVDTWGGFLWANLEPSAAPLTDPLGGFFAKFDRFPFATFGLGGQLTYEVEANWKLLVENFSECYHCAPVHPNLNRLTPYLSGGNEDYFHGPSGRSRYAGGYMEFTKDYTSMTRTGYTDRPFLPGSTAEDRRRVYYYVLFPNLFFSLHPDYLMVHQVWPTSVTHSRIVNSFYFPPETRARAGFDPSDALDLWDEINRQDWRVCELAQQGVGSRAWRGGRYSEVETMVADFDRFVTEEFREPP